MPERSADRTPPTDAVARAAWAGSHAGSHADERPCSSPDGCEHRAATNPRSRTDLNRAGCPHRNLRIKCSQPTTGSGGDDERQGDEHLEDRHAGARAPVPPVYGSGRPAFSPPTVLRGRGRRSVHPVSWRPPKRPAAGDKDHGGEDPKQTLAARQRVRGTSPLTLRSTMGVSRNLSRALRVPSGQHSAGHRDGRATDLPSWSCGFDSRRPLSLSSSSSTIFERLLG